MKKHIARNGIPKKQPNTVGMIRTTTICYPYIPFYIVQVGVDCGVGCGVSSIVSSIESIVHVAKKKIMCVVWCSLELNYDYTNNKAARAVQ